MTLHDMTVRARRQWRHHGLVQMGWLTLVWLLGEAIVRLSGLPLPGGIVGMALLLVALAAGWVRPGSLHRGAQWLLAEMLLFFVPAALAVVDHDELLGWLGLKILVVIVLGTLTVMTVTSLVVDRVLLAARPDGTA